MLVTDPELALPRALPTEPRCRVSSSPDGLAELSLSGSLPSDWSVRLTHALSSRGISLVRGGARRVEGDLWIGRLFLDMGYSEGTRPDFLALATLPRSPGPLFAPQLLDFELRDSPAVGGALLLEVHAWDAIGLLAAVLNRAHGSGLCVEEIALETEGGCAFHGLLLRSALGGAPRAEETRRLERSLARLLG